MRILHGVELYAPSVGGAQEVVRRVSEGLVARGHEVTVATTSLDERTTDVIGGVRIIGFRVSGNQVRGLQGEVAAYRELVCTGGFDVVMLYAAQQWTVDAALDLPGQTPSACVLAPCGFSGLSVPAYAGYFEQLPQALARFDALIVHSSTYRDAAFLARHGLDTVVIPNGAGEDEFTAPPPGFREAFDIAPDEPLVVTVGSHTGLKGHAAAIEVARRTRTARVTLAVLGNASPGGCARSCARRARVAQWRSRDRVRVIVAEVERPLVVSAFAEANVALLTSLIECAPLVLIEAMAAGTPFVTARVGNAEELAVTGAGEVVATSVDPRGFAHVSTRDAARAVDALLADPERCAAMGAAGRAAWQERHTWSSVCGRYEAAYLDAIDARARR